MLIFFSSTAVMSTREPTSDSVPFLSDDSEVEGQEEGGASASPPEEEPASGVSKVRALLTVLILCYINLLNYMDRFTVAGTPTLHHAVSRLTAFPLDFLENLELSLRAK